MVIQESEAPEPVAAPKAVKDEGEWDEDDDIAALQLWLDKQKALKPGRTDRCTGLIN